MCMASDFPSVMCCTLDITRETWRWVRLERIAQDLKYALRQLRTSPGFAITGLIWEPAACCEAAGDVWRVRITSVRGWNLRIAGIPGNPENERIGPPDCARRPAQRRDVAGIAAGYLDAACRVRYRISLVVSLKRSIENIPLWCQAQMTRGRWEPSPCCS